MIRVVVTCITPSFEVYHVWVYIYIYVCVCVCVLKIIMWLCDMPWRHGKCCIYSWQLWPCFNSFNYYDFACLTPSHYLNKYWLIVNWTLVKKFQWNLNQYTSIFTHKKSFENIVCKNSGHFMLVSVCLIICNVARILARMGTNLAWLMTTHDILITPVW